MVLMAQEAREKVQPDHGDTVTEDGKFTVQEYQAMCASGKIKSGVVDLLPLLNERVIIGGLYRTRDGGQVRINGHARNLPNNQSDGTVVWASNGAHYEAATGEVIRESRFHSLSSLIG
jgi:hypothetical protein